MWPVIIELVSSIVEISGNPTLDTVLFGIIGFISFSIAFGLVGVIFDSIGFYDSDVMSDVHWIIRIIVFVSLTWILVKIFQFFAWLLSFPWYVYIVIIAFVIFIVIIVYYIKYKIRKRINAKVETTIESTVINKHEEIRDIEIEKPVMQVRHYYDKTVCPRCGSKLVKRHGPFGNFYGCKSYPSCCYTRSRL